MNEITLSLPSDCTGRKLSSFLKEWFLLSDAGIASLKVNAQILQEKPLKMRDKIRADLPLILRLPEEKGSGIWPVMGFLDILYEDDYLLILNKPAGMSCHPGRGHYFDTVANRVCAYLHTDTVHLFGRLDRETSGILVFAKNGFVLSVLEKQREKGIWQKSYLAFCQGLLPAEGTIEAPIAPALEPNRYQVCAEGKPAWTRYRRILGSETCSLASVTIRTGRTHQIRVHMKSISHPLSGDSFYNKNDRSMERAALHSYLLTGEHPITHCPLRVVCPMPADMKRQLERTVWTS